MKLIYLYTDGSCLGNPGPGGWAALLVHQQAEELITGSEPDSTNNRMEMTAVIEGLRFLKERCTIELHTDSQYVMKAFTEGWLANWKKRGWRTANKDPVKNQDLWEVLDPLVQNHQINWHWVKGHSGHRENELVNDAAIVAAKSLK